MHALLRLIRDAVAVDRGAFTPLRGLRAAVGVALVLGIGVGTGQLAAGVFATIGALIAGTVSFTTGSRTPFATMTGSGLALALSTAVGGLTAHSLPIELVALALWGALAGLSSAAGQAATTVGVQAVVGLVVLGRFPLTWHAALAAAGEVMVGALVQVALAAVVRPPARERNERLALADVAAGLASWALIGGRPASGQIADAIGTTRALLERRTRIGEQTPLRSLLTGLSRARLEVSVLTLQRDRRQAGGHARLELVLTAAAADFTALAAELRSGVAQRRRGDENLAPLLTDRDGVIEHRSQALAGQLRAAHLSLEAWARQRPRPGDRLRGSAKSGKPVLLQQVFSYVRHPTPSARRHAIRLMVLLPVCEGVARVLPLQRGYWVALTAVVVLKPDFATSVQRGIGRVLGTLGGVVPVSILVGLLHPRGAILVVLVGLLAWAAYTSFAAGFALFSGCLAAMIVVLLDVVSPGGTEVAAARAIDTLIGGALAVLTYVLFPTWEGPLLSESVARLVEAEDAYAGKVLASLNTGAAASRPELGACAGLVRAASAALQSALARSEVEPKLLVGASGVVGLRMARDALVANSRIVASLHVLHTHAVEERSTSLADLGPMALALHEVLGDTVRAVREHKPFDDSVDLRAIAAPVVEQEPALLGRELDEIVDAVDTLRFALADRVVQ